MLLLQNDVPDARVSSVLTYSFIRFHSVFLIELIHTYIHAANLYSRDFSVGPTGAL